MTSPVALTRLLLYRIALDRYQAELSKRATTISDDKRPFVAEEILAPAGLTKETVARDLELLGLEPNAPELESFSRSITSALQRDSAESRLNPPLLTNVQPGMLTETLQQTEDRSFARVREEAWEYACAFRSDWSLGLAWFVKDKGPFAHQFNTAKHVIRSNSGNALIADEVGLGKTITAGLLIAELYQYGLASPLLIVVPPNLKQQWLDELAAFFDYRPALINSSSPSALQLIAKAPAVLIDYQRARSTDCAAVLLSRRWSLLIVDEAHRLRNAETEQSRLIYSISAARRLFLTATPVQNAATDVHQVVSHLRPGLLGSRSAFVEQFVGEDGTVREEESLKHRIAEIQTRTRREETELHFPKREIRLVTVAIASPDEHALYESVLGYVQQIERHYSGSIELAGSSRVRQARSIVLLAIHVLRELSSHPNGALRTLNMAMRERLNKLPSSAITREDLNRLNDLIRRFGKLDWANGRHAKSQALVTNLPKFLEASHKIVVYAEFLETIKSLREAIRADSSVKALLLTYTGRLSRREKKAVIERLRAENKPTILLSTDSGGEGLNLQEAGAVVNFDFPWNPMRVEQRIGRIDRLGQKRPKVFIWNLITTGTIEWYVYAVLQEKLDVCRKVVGDLDSPITRVMIRRRQEDLGIGQIILSARDQTDLETKLKQLHDPVPEPVMDYGRKSPIVF